MTNFKKLSKDRWGVTVGIIFVIISLFVFVNRGDLPDIFVVETDVGGDTTFLGKILIGIAFPFAFLALTIEGLLPNSIFILLVIFVEFAFGFIIGLLIKFVVKKFM